MLKRFLICLCLLVPQGAFAEDSALQALVTGDETRGWEAVGRINIGGESFCTGALIAPDLVLTAAHCLFSKERMGPYLPSEFEFLAGLRNGRAAAYRGVKRVLAHPSYAYIGPENLGGVPYDLALLQLDQPIRLASIAPYDIGPDPVMDEQLEVVSYAFDRADAPSRQESCHVIAPDAGLTVFSCQVDFGSSGAPIFRMREGKPEIVAVVSAKAELDGQKVSLGAQLNMSLQELMQAYQAGASTAPVKVQSVSRLPQILQSDSATGAKFVTP